MPFENDQLPATFTAAAAVFPPSFPLLVPEGSAEPAELETEEVP
jgi:hypothetical protein